LRYEFAEDEWIAIRPWLPTKPHGVPRVDNRRILNGIVWVLHSGASWRDLGSFAAAAHGDRVVALFDAGAMPPSPSPPLSGRSYGILACMEKPVALRPARAREVPLREIRIPDAISTAPGARRRDPAVCHFPKKSFDINGGLYAGLPA
jgi:hypothetical protein